MLISIWCGSCRLGYDERLVFSWSSWHTVAWHACLLPMVLSDDVVATATLLTLGHTEPPPMHADRCSNSVYHNFHNALTCIF